METEGHVRQARVGDAAEMLAIYAPFVRETAISYEFEPPTESEFAARIERTLATDPWLVAVRGDEIAGYAYAAAFRSRPAYATTRETTVYVHPDHHGTGVGRELLTCLLAELTTLGVRTAIAVISLPNPASIALHESLGYTSVGTIHDVARKFEVWHDQELWELHLST